MNKEEGSKDMYDIENWSKEDLKKLKLKLRTLEEVEKFKEAEWLQSMDENSDQAEFERPDFDDKYYFYRKDREYRKVDVDALLYLEAKDNYVHLHYPEGKFIVIRSTLEALIRELPLYAFIRINRTYCVAVKHVTVWTKEYVKISGLGLQFPVSKAYYPLLEYRFEVLGAY